MITRRSLEPRFTISPFREIILFALTTLSLSTLQAATIYTESFSGDSATDLNGTAPEVRPGSEVWAAATGIWKTDGTAAQDVALTDYSAFIPFIPTAGRIYTLSATLEQPIGATSGRWGAIGFSAAATTTGSFYSSPNNTSPWVLYRAVAGSGSTISTFTGTGTTGSATEGNYSGTQTLTIVLNTTGASWTVEWFVGGTSVRTFTFSANPTISYIGLGREDGAGVDFSSFTLSDDTPSTADGTWLTDGDGYWGVPSNWQDSTIANGTGYTANFTSDITANRAVTITRDRTIGNITFSDASHDLTITNSADESLTLDVSSGSPEINITTSGRTLTLAIPLSGTKGLKKTGAAGAGNLVLSGANTYSGTTILERANSVIVSSFNSVTTDAGLGTVHSASSSLGVAGSVEEGTIYLGSTTGSWGVTLKYVGPGETTDRILHFRAFQSGNTKTIDNSGSGLLKFTSVFSGSGVSAPITLTGASNGEIVNGLPFSFTNLGKGGTGTWTIGGSVLNTGSITVSGTGTLILAGTHDAFTSSITLNTGSTLQVGTNNAATLGNGGVCTGAITLWDSTILHINSTANQTLNGSISQLGAIEKSSSGTLTLSGTNTYTGATTINGGTLEGVVGGSCSNSAFTVASGATLGIDVTTPGQQWTCSGLAFSAGSTTLAFAFTGLPSSTVAPLKILNNVTFTGVPSVTIAPAINMPGLYPLLEVGGTAPATTPSLSGSPSSHDLHWGGPGNKTLFLHIPSGSVFRFR